MILLYRDGVLFSKGDDAHVWVLDVPYEVKTRVDAYARGLSGVNTYKRWRWQKTWEA